jgi:hypothetical protein
VRRFMLCFLAALMLIMGAPEVQAESSNLHFRGEGRCLRYPTLHDGDEHLVREEIRERKRVFAFLYKVLVRKVYDMHYVGEPHGCGEMIIKEGRVIEVWELRWW